MAETLADLLHEAGIDYSGAATQIAEQTPYTPSTPLRRPTPGPSAREAQRRMLLGAPKDVAQAGRNYQQNYVSQLRDGRLPDAVRDLPGQALELTGLPSFRRAGRAAASGDLPTAALETGMGALGVVGMGAAIRPAVRPLLGAARAPAEAAAVVADDGLGQFHRPMLSRYGANDRGGPERVRAALRNDLSDPHGRPLNDERDTLSLGPYQYWWGRRYVNGRDIGPPRNPAPEQLGEAGVPPRDPVGSARAQWDLDPNDPILRGSPDIAADPATTLRGAAMRPRGPMRSQSLPNEDRRWPAFGAPAESPQRIPRAIQPQTRASDGTILPAQPRETFGRPFRRTEASSDDLREAAAMPPQLRGGTPEALQRAREQGFDVDTPLYHGTGRDFDEFRDNGGIWASSDPAEASGYAQRRSEIFQDGDPRVIPVFMRNAQNAGTHYYVTNPADIRSRFAAFDPARSGESDLLASSAAPRDAGEPFQWGRHSDIKPSADPALVDAHGARDYDRALAARGGAPQAIADDLRQQPRGWDTEHAAYEARNGVYPITSGGQVSARPGPVPYSARGRIYMHHTHPNHGVEDLPNPLSTTDIKWLTQRPAVRGIYAHEYMGGGSYAERGGRAGNRRAGEAIDRGEEAARKRLGDQSPLADHVTNRAARRHGVLRRYGYRPSNDDQAIMLDAAQKDMSRAEWDALRAMHGPIYGLPYPLSWGRIGAATGAGLAANAMLERRK